ncbi:MAG: HEAT repeat domain-containing protein [Phycisphaerae bacterium]|nr:HEAT repeat domain-containing protein [Phycisphaerae bacterium]
MIDAESPDYFYTGWGGRGSGDFRDPYRFTDPALVPLLIATLENRPGWTQDPYLVKCQKIARCYAAVWLGRTKDPRALEPLMAILKDPANSEEGTDPRMSLRSFAIKGLGCLGHPAAIDPIIQELNRDTEFRLRGILPKVYQSETTYLMALAGIRDPRSLRFLLEYLTVFPGESEQRNLDFLIHSCMCMYMRIHSREFYAYLKKQRLPELPTRALWRHWMKEGRSYTRKCFEEEWQQLQSGEPDSNAYGGFAMGIERLGIPVLPLLIDKIRDGKTELIRTVRSLTNEEIPSNATKEQCLDWWQQNWTRWTVPFEEYERNDWNPGPLASDILRQAVLQTVGREEYERQNLHPYIRNESEKTPPYWAFGRIPGLQHPDGVEYLLSVLEHGPDWKDVPQNDLVRHFARCYAALGLGESGDPQAFGPLVKGLDENDYTEIGSDPVLGKYCMPRYAGIALGDFDDPGAVKPLFAILEKSVNPLVCRDCIVSIGYIGDPRAIEPLLRLTTDHEDWIAPITEALFRITRIQFEVQSYQKDGQWITSYPDFPQCDIQKGDARQKVRVFEEWFRDGGKWAETKSKAIYTEWKQIQNVTPSDHETIQKRFGSVGIAALPFLVEKIRSGDQDMIHIARSLVRGDIDQYPSQEIFLEWWEKNQQRWLIPYPDSRLR